MRDRRAGSLQSSHRADLLCSIGEMWLRQVLLDLEHSINSFSGDEHRFIGAEQHGREMPVIDDEILLLAHVAGSINDDRRTLHRVPRWQVVREPRYPCLLG